MDQNWTRAQHLLTELAAVVTVIGHADKIHVVEAFHRAACRFSAVFWKPTVAGHKCSMYEDLDEDESF